MNNWESSITIKVSAIDGYGLFATMDIPENTVIMEIKGDVIDEEECIRREEEENNVYIFWNDINYIDTAMTDKIKYINHHCDPNCCVDDGEDNLSLKLISRRFIGKGEEITIDYGYKEIYENCKCGKCR